MPISAIFAGAGTAGSTGTAGTTETAGTAGTGSALRVVLNAQPFLARAKHIPGAIPVVSVVPVAGSGLAKRLAPAKPSARAWQAIGSRLAHTSRNMRNVIFVLSRAAVVV